MISGAHMIIYSADAEADRAFFRVVLGFPSVDAGHGWLIFALPPAEIAFHPAAENGNHEIYLMCDDVAATIETLEEQKVNCGPLADLGWACISRNSCGHHEKMELRADVGYDRKLCKAFGLSRSAGSQPLLPWLSSAAFRTTRRTRPARRWNRRKADASPGSAASHN